MKLIPRFRERARQAVLYKHNSSFLAALTALSGHDHEFENKWKAALNRSVDGVIEAFSTGRGEFVYELRLGQKTVSPLRRIPMRNNILIELLLDASSLTGRADLALRAAELADYWLGKKSDETGLLPEDDEKGNSEVDSITDFAVNLFRINNLTGDDRYLVEGLTILNPRDFYHLTAYGHASRSHILTRAATDVSLHTRFIALTLTPFIASEFIDIHTHKISYAPSRCLFNGR